jgi:hypothetical protein
MSSCHFLLLLLLLLLLLQPDLVFLLVYLVLLDLFHFCSTSMSGFCFLMCGFQFFVVSFSLDISISTVCFFGTYRAYSLLCFFFFLIFILPLA